MVIKYLGIHLPPGTRNGLRNCRLMKAAYHRSEGWKSHRLGWTSRWVTVWLDDQAWRGVVNESYSARMLVTSATQPGSALFNIFISDLEQVTKYAHQVVDDTRLGGPDSALEGRPAIQRDLGRLEGWAYRNRTKFSKDKCKVLFVGRKSPWQGYRLGGEALWEGPWGCEGGDVSQKCTLAAKEPNSILCCITRHVISRSREAIVCYSALARSHPRTKSWFGLPGTRNQSDFSRGHHHLPCEDRLRDLGLLSLEKKWLWGGTNRSPPVPGGWLLRGWSQATCGIVW
ncbi:hypothetical protein QYF61_024120 [Mycteria americana]|uniref:Reverse transcriptase domain-containing protein n=1 Tax=Mycteria americana TaxID=33587 RepID=A0AAN7S1R3_MYCAM|nr:hypothetical protein QYF61_024120 [Mycteria americana]